MKRLIIATIASLSVCFTANAQSGNAPMPVCHPKIGETMTTDDACLTVTLLTKKQNYCGDEATRDTDIYSPKSVNIHPNGKKYYVNSLEGASTVCYDMTNNKKLKVIKHNFDGERDKALWSEPSGLYEWKHYSNNVNTFYGKPVESTFSHKGRYLWVPYYRRSFDINAQDPSAVAIIDTECDSIIRLMETGPLPKMITTSPDGKTIAISQWGNNTVGLIDISSGNPKEWKYTAKLIVDYELQLNYPLNVSVDRDNGSGYALRGTVFTPDNKYLLVGCMGGGGGIAVIDIATRKYLGRITGMMDNIRHIILSNGYIYLSVNRSGVVQRAKLSEFIASVSQITNQKGSFTNWENVKVGAGARTIVITPNGRYIFAACNIANSLYVIDTKTMKVIGHIDADSYPVGLDISSDGRYVFLTSQGRAKSGGNCVDIFEITYKEDVTKRYCIQCGEALDATSSQCKKCGLDITAASSGTIEKAPEEKIEVASNESITEELSTYIVNNKEETACYILGGIVILGVVGGYVFKKKKA